MLSTKKLQKYILKELKKGPAMSTSILHFCEGQPGSEEGVYVFSKDGRYMLQANEKGTLTDMCETTDKREILWGVVNNVSIDTMLQYARSHTPTDVDFRRAMFEKELEIFSAFGADFKQRKEREIAEILERFPYNDDK